MTEHRRPPACHYDRAFGGRVTLEHRDDCEHPDTHRGCKPCTAPHCAICGREHATNDQPQTCPGCQLKTDQDLTELATAYVALATEALDGGRDGRLVAAAPIPGGTAQVLMGPTVPTPALKFTRTLVEDHHHGDPLPPLAVLSQWEDLYRAFLDHTPGQRRGTVATTIAYLRSQLPYMAQRTDGPDYHAFTRQVRDLRAHLERALHNEQAPERGVECFECGDPLERRFRKATPCTHDTPARTELQRWARLGYPEALTVVDVRAAYRPCGLCDQGGITDPRAGLSWECPGCRKEYDAGEYASAVRRDLLDKQIDGDGWTHISVAAEAASTLTDGLVLAGTVRKWMESRSEDGPKVSSCCLWTPGHPWGVRLVFWPDVAEQAVLSARRSVMMAAARRQKAEQVALDEQERTAS